MRDRSLPCMGGVLAGENHPSEREIRKRPPKAALPPADNGLNDEINPQTLRTPS